MATTAPVPTFVRIPGYGVQWWSPRQLDQIAARFAKLHQPEPWEAAPSCLFDGESWPCASERWRRQHEQHEDVDRHSGHAVRKSRRHFIGLGVCLVLGLHLTVMEGNVPVNEPREPAPELAQPSYEPLHEVQVFYVDGQPAFFVDERSFAAKAAAQAEMREARAALLASRRLGRVDSRFVRSREPLGLDLPTWQQVRGGSALLGDPNSGEPS